MKHSRATILLLGMLMLSAEMAAADGKTLFDQHCAACHAAAGAGTPGVAPPLVNPELFVGLADQLPEYFFGVLTAGLSGTIEVEGVGYFGLVMPSQGQLGESELLLLADYVIKDLNKIAASFSLDQIRAAKAQPLSHGALIKIRKSVP